MTLHGWAEAIKHYWGAMAATVAALGILFSGVSYYAKAETNNMIKIAMVDPLKKQNEKINELNSKLNSMQRDIDKQNGQLRGVEGQLDIIIQLLQPPHRRDPDMPRVPDPNIP